jgi:hypothetical protein
VYAGFSIGIIDRVKWGDKVVNTTVRNFVNYNIYLMARNPETIASSLTWTDFDSHISNADAGAEYVHILSFQ